MVAMGLFMTSQKTFDKLPADVQKVIIQAGSEASVYERGIDDEQNSKYLAKMSSKGSTLVKVDKSGFIARALPLHDRIAKELKAEDLLQIVREDAKRAKWLSNYSFIVNKQNYSKTACYVEDVVGRS